VAVASPVTLDVNRGMPPAGQPQLPPKKLAAQIIIEIDGRVVSKRTLDKTTLTIGRLAGNDIPVPSPRVSRTHAKIFASNGSWVIEDAESLNGLVYQGDRIDRLALTPGDRIFLARQVLLEYRTAS